MAPRLRSSLSSWWNEKFRFVSAQGTFLYVKRDLGAVCPPDGIKQCRYVSAPRRRCVSDKHANLNHSKFLEGLLWNSSLFLSPDHRKFVADVVLAKKTCRVLHECRHLWPCHRVAVCRKCRAVSLWATKSDISDKFGDSTTCIVKIFILDSVRDI